VWRRRFHGRLEEVIRIICLYNSTIAGQYNIEAQAVPGDPVGAGTPKLYGDPALAPEGTFL
jgi:hypothetical protein